MTRVTLPARCDRAATEALYPELSEALASGPCTIDGGEVRQVGLAILQLLASARKSSDALTISASPALADAARLAGLSQHLFGEEVQ